MFDPIKSMDVIPFSSILKYTTVYINSKKDIDSIRKAYNYAIIMHKTQIRKSEEPYVNHVINVAVILANLQVAPTVIISGLLHDVVEDCDVSIEEITDSFGEEVASIVDAVTKLGNLPKIIDGDDEEYLANNQRKIFIAMSKDIRVILVKLADRLHNMLTLQHMKPEKQQKIAKETLNVYASIAHRLGLGEIKAILEDRCLYYLDKDAYFEIAKLVDLKKIERDNLISNMVNAIDSLLIKNNIIVHISGRSKHLYSIYKKMKYNNKKFEEIYDLQAIRIIAKDVMTCYGILGFIHNKYRPIPGRFKDYIAMKKPNMYQSLHTTIIGEGGSIFEVQIRTKEMDDIAERGFAAHWRYKEGGDRISQKAIEEQLHWFRDFVSLSDDANDVQAKEYMHNLQRDIFEANVYVMTPKGKVIHLPKDSCVIDFAYKIHSKIAETMIGAVVNGKFVPFNTKLKTGDVIEIKTQKNAPGPTEGWLDIVKTSNARQRIKQYLKTKNEREHLELVNKGHQLLNTAIKGRELDPKLSTKQEAIERCISFYKATNFDDILVKIALKLADIDEVIDSLYNIKAVFSVPKLLKKRVTNMHASHQGVIVDGIDSVAIELASCCTPIPGDEIIGYVSTGKPIKVHRSDCHNLKGLNSNAFIPVKWDSSSLIGKYYYVNISVLAFDRMYLLSDVITSLSQNNANVASFGSNVMDLETTLTINVRVTNGEHLSKAIANVKKIDGVIDVIRLDK